MDDKSFIVIGKWMISKLNLKNSELLVFAAIFTASGYQTHKTFPTFYKPTISDLKDKTGYSKSHISKTLIRLEERGLIERFKDKNVYRFEAKIMAQ